MWEASLGLNPPIQEYVPLVGDKLASDETLCTAHNKCLKELKLGVDYDSLATSWQQFPHCNTSYNENSNNDNNGD